MPQRKSKIFVDLKNNSFSNKEKYVKICPKCRSKDVSPNMSVASIVSGAFQNECKCNKCGYNGMFFPEIEESIKKKNKDVK